MVLAVADPLAGMLHARSRRRFLRKSLEGSLVFFLVSLLVLSFLWPWPQALFVSFGAMWLENVSPLDDNFVLPLAVSGALYVWPKVLGLF